MHPLLKRQLKMHNADKLQDPSLSDLLQEISDSYYRNDRSQTLFERALDLTSEEFLAKAADSKREIHALSGSHEQVEQLLTMLNATVEISTDALLLMDAQGEPVLFSARLPDYLDADDEFLSCLNNDELINHIVSTSTNCDEFKQQFKQSQQDNSINIHCTLSLKSGHQLECQSLPYQQEDEKMGRVWNFRLLS